MDDASTHKLARSSNNSPDAPDFSVILATPYTYSTVETTVRYLAAQTVAHRIELVIPCPNPDELSVNVALASAFHSWRAVRVPPPVIVSVANAAGVRAATATVVALAEDHCFPAPDWAERLIERHRGPWAAVGPVLSNANPENGVSLADFFIAYAMWAQPKQSGPVDYLPGHNSSYKRDVLLALGDTLEEYLNAEYVLHEQLRQQGHRLYLESGAVTRHTNFSLWSSYLAMHLHAGRSFAASRSCRWSPLRRAFYALASPLIPLVRFQRILRQALTTAGSRRQLMATLPALGAGLIISAAGEALGYAVGAGNSRARMAYYEFHRYRHTRSGRYLSPPGTVRESTTVAA